MNSDDGFVARNARYMDRTVHRWEILLGHHVRRVTGGYETAAAAEEGLAVARQRMRELDAELAGLRDAAAERGGRFPLDQVVETYGLSAIEAAILELALTPQLDMGFRGLIAQFRNNKLLDFVDVDLALSLIFESREVRFQARRYFAADAPLFAHRVLMLRDSTQYERTGLLAKELRPPERLADFVMCRQSLDPALSVHAKLVRPTVELNQVVLPAGEAESLERLLDELGTQHAAGMGTPPPFLVGRGLTLELSGPPGTGKTLAAHALAHRVRRPLIHVDSASLNAAADFPDLVDALFTEARVQGAVLLLDRCEPLFAKGNPRTPAVLRQLESFGGLAVLTNSKPDAMDPSVERHVAWKVDLAMPDVDQRQRIWSLLKPAGLELAGDVDLEDVAARFELTGGQIGSAWEVAWRRARARTEGGPARTDMAELKRAAQAQIRANMGDYSVRSKVNLSFEDLVLPEKEKVLIEEVLQACENRVFVMNKWGFGKRLVTGKGICVLFKGEPGTGKTLCAEILASELGMKLYQISIPKIVSKYIGETEKNIAKVFSAARANHSMLLFDEADSLFAKRVAVEKSVDRFSNMETNMLLQEIERFEGIAILTTNLDKNMDDAFARRIQFKIDFPFPDASHRAAIWRKLFPADCPVDGDIDFDRLGESFELSGGHIKNAVVRAAYRAAARRRAIRWDDVEFAAEQECKNAGKLFRTAGRRAEAW